MIANHEAFATIERTTLAEGGPTRAEVERIKAWLENHEQRFEAKASASGAELELSILGVIGGGWFSDGISAKAVKRALDDNKNAKAIRVLIDSPGGDYFDGVAIMNLLKRHAATVTVEIIGEASSAGSVIAMGGDRIEMHAGTIMMVHRAWSMSAGNGDDHRSTGQLLDKVDDGLLDVYAARTGKDRASIEALVKATTWMNSAEAVRDGFADAEVPAKQKPAVKDNGPKSPSKVGSARALAARENTTPPPPAEADKTAMETETMSAIPATILAALGLPGTADESACLRRVEAFKGRDKIAMDLEDITGKSAEEALGTVRAWKESAAKLPELEKQMGEVKAAAERSELDTLLQKGREEKKLTKAEADKLRARVEGYMQAKAEKREPSGDEWSIAQARAYVDALPVQPHLAGTGASAPLGSASTGPQQPAPQPNSGALVWNGKAYEDLTYSQRAALAEEDPQLHRAMKRDWEKRGEPEATKPAPVAAE
jgi:ATP-dependent Clp protease, protease subunit